MATNASASPVPSDTRTSVRVHGTDVAGERAGGGAVDRSHRPHGRALTRAPSPTGSNKHGLVSQHAAKHAARGGVDREVLVPLVERGLSVQQIAEELGVGGTTVRHWLRTHGLKTQPCGRLARDRSRRPAGQHRADLPASWRHDLRAQSRRQARTGVRRCRVEAVSARRRRVKRILIEEAGGACRLCGYDRYAGALQFPPRSIRRRRRSRCAGRGLTRSLDRALGRRPAKVRATVCANCHAEVEAGLSLVLIRPYGSPTSSGVDHTGPG